MLRRGQSRVPARTRRKLDLLPTHRSGEESERSGNLEDLSYVRELAVSESKVCEGRIKSADDPSRRSIDVHARTRTSNVISRKKKRRTKTTLLFVKAKSAIERDRAKID